MRRFGRRGDSPGERRLPARTFSAAADTNTAAFWIAEFRHDPGIGGKLVLRVRGGLRERGLTDVIAEEGFFLQPTARAGGAGGPRNRAAGNKVGAGPAPRWETVWWPEDLRTHPAFQPTPVPVGAMGAELLRQLKGRPRLALIDSGDERAQQQHLGPGPVQPRDALGHGSSVGDLIRLAHQESHDGVEADLECYQDQRAAEPDEDEIEQTQGHG